MSPVPCDKNRTVGRPVTSRFGAASRGAARLTPDSPSRGTQVVINVILFLNCTSQPKTVGHLSLLFDLSLDKHAMAEEYMPTSCSILRQIAGGSLARTDETRAPSRAVGIMRGCPPISRQLRTCTRSTDSRVCSYRLLCRIRFCALRSAEMPDPSDARD
jgi:hypothetical protein